MKTGSQSEDPFKTGSERMRGQFAGAILLGIAAVANANAADLSGGQGIGGGYGLYAPFVSRMEPVIVYDYEPGVIVRCYWCPPWQNRHYFPRTGHRPKVGRREILPARAHAEASRVLSLLVGLVRVRAATLTGWPTGAAGSE